MRILEWITDKETLLISGKIEKVNSDMLDKLISTETDILVFLYRENNLADQDLIDQVKTSFCKLNIIEKYETLKQYFC